MRSDSCPPIFRRLSRGLAAALVLAAFSSPAMAARGGDEPEAPPPDARLEGFTRDGKIVKVALPPSGSAGTWALFAVLTVVAGGVMFKNGKRTHLD